MKVTIIPEDNVVIIDGQRREFEFIVDSNIHAVQWNGEYGTVETKKGDNWRITDLSEFQDIIDRHAAILAQEEADKAEQEAIYNLPENVLKREILSLESQITPRRLREAVLTQGGADWLAAKEAEIETKRKSL